MALLVSLLPSHAPALASGPFGGHVTNTDGDPLPKIEVGAWQAVGDVVSYVGTTTTDASGAYDFTSVYPYSWVSLDFTDASGVYARRHLGSRAAGEFDVVMHRAGAISGRVTCNGQPVAGVVVEAGGRSDSAGGLTTTDAGGHYRIGGLDQGGYRVSFGDPAGRMVATRYPGVPAEKEALAATVTVTEGSETIGIDQAMQEAGAISGTVTGLARDGKSQISVWALTRRDASGNWLPDRSFAHFAHVNEDGTYKIVGLAPGVYRIDFWDEWYGGQHYYGGWTDVSGGKDVTVEAGRTTTGIDGRFGGAPTLSIASSPLRVSGLRPFVLSGVLSPGGRGDSVSVEVRKPRSARWSYSSRRIAASGPGPTKSKWWYRYTPRLKGVYSFRASFKTDTLRASALSRTVVVTVR